MSHFKRNHHTESGYSKRSKVETSFSRYKAIIGPAMRARGLASQRVEARIGCKDGGAGGTEWPDGWMIRVEAKRTIGLFRNCAPARPTPLDLRNRFPETGPS